MMFDTAKPASADNPIPWDCGVFYLEPSQEDSVTIFNLLDYPPEMIRGEFINPTPLLELIEKLRSKPDVECRIAAEYIEILLSERVSNGQK